MVDVGIATQSGVIVCADSAVRLGVDTRNASIEEAFASLKALVQQSRCAVISLTQPGSFKMRVFANEEPDAALLARAWTSEKNRTLRLESGQLLVGAAEEFLAPAGSNANLHAIVLAPGEYLISGYVIEPSKEDMQPLLVDQVVGCGILATLAGCVAVIGVVAYLGVLSSGMVIGLVALAVVFWALVGLWVRSPSAKRMREQKDASVSPSLVVALSGALPAPGNGGGLELALGRR